MQSCSLEHGPLYQTFRCANFSPLPCSRPTHHLIEQMAKSVSLLYSVPDAHGILFVRLILLALSIAALGLYAATLSIYNSRIASTGALTPSRPYPLIMNGVSLIPSTISIIWSITHLSLLARKLLDTHRCKSRGLVTADEGREAWDGRRAVVHPGWLLFADGVCWALFLVVSVLTGREATKWKTGKVGYGSDGTRQVDLGACPTVDPATGMLDYWCEQAWNEVVNLSNSGVSILGTLACVHIYLIPFPPCCLPRSHLISPFNIYSISAD